jgi:predicted transcriptional regulator
VRATVQIGVRFPVGLRKRIEHAADREDVTMSEIVLRAVAQYFDRQEEEA